MRCGRKRLFLFFVNTEQIKEILEIDTQLRALYLPALTAKQTLALCAGSFAERHATLTHLRALGVSPTHFPDFEPAELLTAAFGDSAGLDADCSFQIWRTPFFRVWIADNENGTFSALRRLVTDDVVTWDEIGEPVTVTDLPWLIARYSLATVAR